MSAENIHLTSSEWHVMEFLWDHTPCTGREATSCLEKINGLEPQHHTDTTAKAGEQRGSRQ